MAPLESLGALDVDPAVWGLLVMLVVAVCALIVLVARATRSKKLPRAVAVEPALTPILGRTEVTRAQLCAWHRTHGESVRRWIENHHEVLERFSDSNMAIDLTAGLARGHERLEPAMDEAIAQHPIPQMRAQLSGLALASRNTLESLRRSNWANAAKDHRTYLEYRQIWLARLDEFAPAEPHGRGLPDVEIRSDDVSQG